jgi:hypothetical protein
MELTTTITVPFVFRMRLSTSSGVRASSTPKRVRSSRIGLINISGYGMGSSVAQAKKPRILANVEFLQIRNRGAAPEIVDGIVKPLQPLWKLLPAQSRLDWLDECLSPDMPTLIFNQVTLSFGRFEIACGERRPVTLGELPDIFPDASALLRQHSDPVEIVHEICDIVREGCELEGSHEHLFLMLYFGRVIEKLKDGLLPRDVLLPLPKTQFALGEERKFVTVDFAFWTGERFIAVFIHESTFELSGDKERLLRMWGFDVFCLVADEFEMQGLSGEAGLRILDAVHLR